MCSLIIWHIKQPLQTTSITRLSAACNNMITPQYTKLDFFSLWYVHDTILDIDNINLFKSLQRRLRGTFILHFTHELQVNKLLRFFTSKLREQLITLRTQQFLFKEESSVSERYKKAVANVQRHETLRLKYKKIQML